METNKLQLTRVLVRLFVIATLVMQTIPTIVRPAAANAANECTEAYLRDIGAMVINCKQQQVKCDFSKPTTTAAGKLYMIGDSITEGTKAELNVALTSRGFGPLVIDGLSSRRLSEGPDLKDGQTVLEKSTSSYTDANTVIIELGTNGGLTNESIKKAVTTVRNAPSPAKIFMVNIGVNNAARKTPLDPTAWNNALNANAELLDYTVIDWASVVAKHPEYIDKNPDTGLGVHPAAGTGRKAFADTIAASVSGTASAQSASGCRSSSTPNGSDNQQIAYNYFVDKGLTPIQSAAIVGNMIGESGVNPGRMEVTFFSSGHPCHQKKLGWPAETDNPPVDNIFGPNTDCVGYAGKPTGNVQPGFGLVQWSGGRRAGVIAFAKSKSVLPNDLMAQLDYVWEELNGAYKQRVYIPLVAATTIEVAVDIWVRKYEIPGNPDGAVRKRIPMALDVLNKYGSK